MMEMIIIEKVKYLKDYKKPDFGIQSVNLTIELCDTDAVVTSILEIHRNEWVSKDTDLVLDGVEQDLQSIRLDGQLLKSKDYTLTKSNLTLPISKDSFVLTITTRISPQKNTSLEGLYLAENIFLTQCESHGFRRITYYLDRPDIMSIFTVKLIADKKYPVLLSNGDKVESGELDRDRHYAIWHDSSNKPSYLFAVVFGDLAIAKDTYITASGKRVALEIYAPEEDIANTSYAMKSLKSAMKWDEDVFGREYDLNTYMIVATPKFNMGAMENKGLNIFNSKYILASDDISTDTDYINVHDVIAHEYFHNWTGNRITLRDWFQLTLKEGLTVYREHEFSADEFSRPLKRIEDANSIKTHQFPEDSGPLSHPIRPDSYIKMDNFYTSTVYEKGSEVVRMIRTIVGDNKFFDGMQRYFENYDGLAITTEDFIKVFEDVSSIDLTQFKLWYSQSGTPIVNVKGCYDEDNKEYRLILEQSTYSSIQQPTKKAFHIPVRIGLIGSISGNNMEFVYGQNRGNDFTLHLKEDRQEFVFQDVVEKPIPSILREFSAPVKVDYSYSDAQLTLLMANDDDGYNRWEAVKKYMTKYILKLSEEIRNNRELHIPSGLISSIESILGDVSLEKNFIARVITLPNEKTIYEEVSEIDPEVIYQAKEYLAKHIAIKLKHDFIRIYNSLHLLLKDKKYELTQTDIGCRALKNVCLDYISLADEEYAICLANDQIKSANNLTDRISALRVFSNSQNDVYCNKALEKFYNQWKHEELVVYKWLSLQSMSKRDDVLAIVQKLLKHEAFDFETPNKIFAIVGGFVGNNSFHNLDGKGYKFLANMIIDVDKNNAQTASRIAKMFSNWKKFEPQRKGLMREEIDRVKQFVGLSDNVSEVINSILG